MAWSRSLRRHLPLGKRREVIAAIGMKLSAEDEHESSAGSSGAGGRHPIRPVAQHGVCGKPRPCPDPSDGTMSGKRSLRLGTRPVFAVVDADSGLLPEKMNFVWS